MKNIFVISFAILISSCGDYEEVDLKGKWSFIKNDIYNEVWLNENQIIMIEDFALTIEYFDCEIIESKVIMYEAETKFDSLIFSVIDENHVSMYNGTETYTATASLPARAV